MSSTSERDPSYVKLFADGTLQQRTHEAVSSLRQCRLCPRACERDRFAGNTGHCRTGRLARVSSWFPHHGEENCLRGWRGSGTIFFSHCNLRCVFCQNFELSHGGEGDEVTAEELAEMMLDLQAHGCHNINFVTPSHVVPQILEALLLAIPAGLRLPLVYNTSAYDSLQTLKWLEGVVDIYMPDFKYWTPELSKRYLTADDYPPSARAAIREMHRQVGDLVLDEQGLARRGLLVRHLVMPGGEEETRQILSFLANEISRNTYVNIMPQYRPAGKVNRDRFAELNRPLTMSEYVQAVRIARELGLTRLDR